MRRLTLLIAMLALPAVSAPPPKLDPSYCAYWLEALGDIARWETMRVEDVPRIAEEENFYAATDFDIELRARILSIQRRIAKDGGMK